MPKNSFLNKSEYGFADNSFIKIMSSISAISALMAVVSAFFGRDSEPYVISLLSLTGIMVVSLMLCYYKAGNLVRYFLPITTTIWVIFACLAFGSGLGEQNYLIIALICLAIFGKNINYKTISIVVIILVAALINIHQQFYLPYFTLPKAAPVFYVINTIIPLIAISSIYIFVFNSAKKSERIIRDQKLSLENSLTFKNMMLSVIGHDMRTPFINTKGILELLDTDELTANDKKSLTVELQTSVDLSLETLDNILEWATQAYYGDKSEMKIKPERIVLYDLIEKLKLFFNHGAMQKNIIFKNDIPPTLSVLADLEQISFVIRNLTANALKFSNINQTIFFSVLEKSNELIFLVRDEGIGISKETLKSLFNINKRSTMRGTADEKGSGLGLLFSKELIRNHNGELWVESELGIGTTVSFSLPILKMDQGLQ